MRRLERSILVFIGILLISGCSKQDIPPVPTVPAPNQISANYAPLDEASIKGLTEIEVYRSDHPGPIAEVSFNSITTQVLSVYLGDGSLVAWDARSGSIVTEHALGIVSSKALDFTASGSRLMGARSHEISTANKEYVGSVALWNVTTGELLACIWYPCEESELSRYPGHSSVLNEVVGPQGRFFIGYSENDITIDDLQEQYPHLRLPVFYPDARYFWTIGDVAFTETNRRYAVIYEEGRVDLNTIDAGYRKPRQLSPGVQDDLQPVSAATLDGVGRWLAYVRGGVLHVWDLTSDGGQPHLITPLADVVALAFNHDGTLLVAAAGKKLVTWHLSSRSVVAEYATPGITAMTITEDNRLLIWGDEEGAVHLLGILPSQAP